MPHSPSPATSPSTQSPDPFTNPRPQLNFPTLHAGQDGRRPSVQFATHHAESTLQFDGPRPVRPRVQKRMSSPPPPTTYESRVSFDSFDNRDATDFSFTLKSKHRHYVYTKRSRTFLCGTDQNDYSEFALQWLLDELVDDGDEVVCLRVVDKDSKINSDANLEEGKYRTEAHELLDHIKAKNKDDEKSISLVLEFAVGKVQDTIQRMIAIYEPACLIVGTRGRSLGGIQGLLPGSVSKYCLQNSPVPVIVVRPTAKREKKKRKRLADPTRRNYLEILERSGITGSKVLDKNERDRLVGGTSGEASEVEARAVAQAIGLPSTFASYDDVKRSPDTDAADGGGLTKVTSVKSDYTSGPDSPSPTGGLIPDDTFPSEMKSPESEALDSPDMSDEEEEEEEESDQERSGHKDEKSVPEALRSGRQSQSGES